MTYDVLLTSSAAAALVVVTLGLALLARRRRRAPASAVVAPDHPGARAPLVAMVVNPTKLTDVSERRAWAEASCVDGGWAPPLWMETTVEDPGTGQAAQAVRQGASTVVAYGGDGTVRAVVASLAGTGVPLGLVPAGTGNLLARNLSIPVNDQDGALRTALGSHVRPIDVGRAQIDVSGEDRDVPSVPFLVMAGLGFDAEVMAAVDDSLKQRVGWWAYVLAGAQNLRGQATRVTLRLDGRAPLRRRVRSVVVGNCGELTGGVRLMPDAQPDDGWLDVVVISPRGVVGWAAVTATVLTRSRRGHPVVEHFRCRQVRIEAERSLQVQLDGDPVGAARALRMTVDEHALLVKTPQPTP